MADGNSCKIDWGTTDVVQDASETEVQQENTSATQELQKADESNEAKASSVTTGKLVGSMGGSYPLIQINGYTFSNREIMRLEIDQMDFYPTINLILKVDSGVFITRHFPKDGDLINIFIRSFNDVLKPIRNDYLITKITSSPAKDDDNSEMYFYFKGILRVPLLYAETCKGIENKTSFEALALLANELNLGFASNETVTKDAQNWLCPYFTYKDFIKEITSHSWKDDSSFFWTYIDYYYNLNFVNLNRLFVVNDEEEPTEGLMRNTMTHDFDHDSELHHTNVKNVLTNNPEARQTNYYYNGMQMVNNSGEIDILNGYKRVVHFFEKSLEKNYRENSELHSQITVDPMITPKAKGKKVILKGRKNEDWYTKEIKHKWQGMQYSLPDHNVHSYYKYAEIHNFQNIEEMYKLNIKVNLPNPNFNFYKGQRIPLMLLLTRDMERIKVAGNVDDQARTIGATLDRFISGQYTVLGIKLLYVLDPSTVGTAMKTSGKFTQELLLGRREWSMPDSPKFVDDDDPTQWIKNKPL